MRIRRTKRVGRKRSEKRPPRRPTVGSLNFRLFVAELGRRAGRGRSRGVLFRSSMTDLLPGQRVILRAESVPRGLPRRPGSSCCERTGRRIGRPQRRTNGTRCSRPPPRGSPDRRGAGGLRQQGLCVAHAGRRENHICLSAPDFRGGPGIAKGGGIPADRRPRRLLDWTAGAADTPTERLGGSMH